MGKWNVVMCALLCLSLAGCKSQPPVETKIPQEDVDRKNPVETNAASIAEGMKVYSESDCALCHGKDGGGKGVEAKDISMNLHDWRKPESLDKFTDGELYYLIAKGKGRMPKYEVRETSDAIWHMVTYIRSLPVGEAHP
jgi:mono/diheme cytochrome c family protein